jgi:oleandomycin transport system permease protein
MTAAVLDPLPAGADPAGGGRPLPLLRHSLLLAGRTILRIRRTPEQLFDVTFQPIIFLFLFVYLFGGAISGSTHDYLQYVLPALMVQTVLFSSMTIGVNLNTDIGKGVFDRFRSLPIPRSAPLVGAVLGDVVRYVISIVVSIAAGYVMGFRIGTDPLRAALGCLVLVLFSICLCWISVLVGMIVREPGGVQGISFMLMFPLTFGSSMFVPVDTMPGWLQSWVHVNPVTHLVDTVRALMIGGEVAWPLTQTLLWSAGILAVFAPLAVWCYRRRA